MVEIAYKFQGTVDKHIGDSIMVIFGSPVMRSDDTVSAVKSAIEMQRTAIEIDRDLSQKDGLNLRIGI